MASICNQSQIKHSYYVKVPMSNSTTGHNDTCWIYCDSSSTLRNATDLGLSLCVEESITAGITALITSIPGTILNSLVILAIMRSQALRKEYLTPSIASIAITDLLFSIYVFPVSLIITSKGLKVGLKVATSLDSFAMGFGWCQYLI